MPNLTNEPCLSVLTDRGTCEHISLGDLAANPSRYLSLHGYSPQAETAIIVTLAAMVADAMNLALPYESSENRYVTIQRGPEETSGTLGSYLKDYADCFEADPSLTAIPFMQSRDPISVPTVKGYMLAEYGSDAAAPAPFPTVVGNMLAINLFSLGGISTPAKGDTRIGKAVDSKGNKKPAVDRGKFQGTPVCPMGLHQTFLLVRSTLFATVCANVSLSMVGACAGVPYWRLSAAQRPDAYGLGGNEVHTVLHYMTAPYRMIRLVFNADGTVSSATSTPGIIPPSLGTNESRRLVRQFSPYAVIKDGEPSIVNPHPAGGLADLKTFLMEPVNADGRMVLPEVLKSILTLFETDVTDKDADLAEGESIGDTLNDLLTDIRVRALSINAGANLSKYADVTTVEASFDLRAFNVPKAAEVIVQAITTAAEARTYYMHAVNDVTPGMSRTETYSFNCFENALSPVLRGFIASIHQHSCLADKEKEWEAILKAVARNAFDEFSSTLPRSSLRIYTVSPLSKDKTPPMQLASARGKFLYRVGALFAKEDTKKGTK